MYSNDYTQIKNGLVNYIGSLLEACPFDGIKASRQYVAATLIEEAIKLMKDEENHFDLYVTKPLLRATSLVYKDRVNVLSEVKNINVSQAIEDNTNMAKNIDTLVNNIKE